MQGTWIEVSGERLWVEDSGAPGAALVFLHGNSLSSASFERQKGDASLARFRQVYFDLPGHGRSRPSPAPARRYSLPGYAECLRALLEALGVESPVLIGHSLGGYIALEAADDITDLAGVLGFGVAPLGSNADIPRAIIPSDAADAAFSEDLTEVQIRQFTRALVADGTQPPGWATRDAEAADGRARAQLAESLGQGRLRDTTVVAKALGHRLALVHCRKDPFVNPAYLEALELSPWRGALQYLDSGHTPQWETPERFNQLLAAFGDAVLSGSSERSTQGRQTQ